MKQALTLIGLVAALSAPAQVTHQLLAVDFEFQPAEIDAEQGDSLHIVFANTTHTFTQVSEETWLANGNAPIGLVDIGPGVEEITIPLDASGPIFYVCAPHAAMGMKGIVNVALAAGFADHVVPLSTMAFYPNPTREQLWLRDPLPTMLDVLFIDAAGREAGRMQTMGSDPIHVGNLPAGLYIVRVVDAAGLELFRQKVTIEQ